MTRILYIMRHGEAVPVAAKDSERTLSEYGKQQVAAAAKHLVGVNLDRCIASPYLRAQQTANIVVQSSNQDLKIETEAKITPDDSAANVVRLLEHHVGEGDVLMVSHQPLVSAVSGLLLKGDAVEGVPFGTGTIAALEFEDFGLGLATLKWLKHTQ